MHIVSKNVAKTLGWKLEYHVKSWRYKQRTPSNNERHTPLENICED